MRSKISLYFSHFFFCVWSNLKSQSLTSSNLMIPASNFIFVMSAGVSMASSATSKIFNWGKQKALLCHFAWINLLHIFLCIVVWELSVYSHWRYDCSAVVSMYCLHWEGQWRWTWIYWLSAKVVYQQLSWGLVDHEFLILIITLILLLSPFIFLLCVLLIIGWSLVDVLPAQSKTLLHSSLEIIAKMVFF